MPDADALRRLRARRGNLTQADLVRAAEAHGWRVEPGRGKGSHTLMAKPGHRALTIPVHRNKWTDQEILKRIGEE